MKFILFVFIVFSSFNLYASVWEDTNSWNQQFEEEYSKWMNSSNVNEKMFTDPTSKYFGINTDCADTAYAFRAIFAFEHNLPFAMNAPSGMRDRTKTLNNKLNRWDGAGDRYKRLIAMITEIGDSVGSEGLAHFDTYSPTIKSISPGTIFMYKVLGKLRNFIRHTYNINNISPIGTFDVIYSTQANKNKHLPLLRRKEFEFEHAPLYPWGFKKFKWPEHLNLNTNELPKELNPSMEQYEIAKLGEAKFFNFVKATLSTENEEAPERLSRLFQSVCNESQARVDYVNQALGYLKETNYKCMEYEMYDAYSTPQRDENLSHLFLKLKNTFEELKIAHAENRADPKILELTEFIFKIKEDSQNALLNACPINYKTGTSISLSTLYGRIENKRLSSHPNDDVEHRWGETTSNGTKCKKWY